MSDEKEAKEWLKKKPRQPWDDPIGPSEAPRKAEPAKKEEPKRDWLNEVDKLASGLEERNKDIARRTRLLREN